MKTYPENLRDLREDNDLNQAALGKLLGITQQQYSYYENRCSELSIRALLVLADYYSVSADYILGRTKCMQDVDVLNQKIDISYTVGEMISDFLALGESGRAFVLESLTLQKVKAEKKVGSPK